jgi:hypothetical protein
MSLAGVSSNGFGTLHASRDRGNLRNAYPWAGTTQGFPLAAGNAAVSNEQVNNGASLGGFDESFIF